MYKLADKNKIMNLFNQRQDVKQIRLKSDISKSTLYRWKAEYDFVYETVALLKKGDIEEVKKRTSTFQSKHKKSDILSTGKIIKYLIKFGYIEYAQQLGEDLLSRYPEDLRARSQLITIAKQKGDWEAVERLCNEILELDPKDLRARSQLITIAKQKAKKGGGEPKNQSSEQQAIRQARQQIHLGEISLESAEEFEAKLETMGISSTYRYILLAEAYQRENIPNMTKKFLKKALQETEDPKLHKTIRGLLQVAQTKNRRPTAINPWDAITKIKSSREKVADDRQM